MQTGREALRHTPWSAPLFESALETDIPHLDQQKHSRSASTIVGVLVDHVAHLRVAVRTNDLAAYTTMLHRLLTRHPELPRLRELEARQQIGLRLDALFQDLHAAEQVATPESSLALLAGNSRGNVSRRRLLRKLTQSEEAVPTPDLANALEDASRQHVHQLLERLRNAGLVYTDAGASTHLHRSTDLGRRAWRALAKAEADEPNTEAPGGLRIKTQILPSETGIRSAPEILAATAPLQATAA